MGKYEYIATVALLCNFSSFGTLLYNVMVTHDTSTLPYAWFYTNILAQVLMIVYAVLNGAYGIYIPTAFLLMGLLYMLYIKSTFTTGKAKGLTSSKVTRPADPAGQLWEPKWGVNTEFTGLLSEPNTEPKLDEGFIF
jgi:hypothetical protein